MDERDDKDDDPISPSDFGWLFDDGDDDASGDSAPPRPARDLYDDDEDDDDELLPPEFLEQEEPQGFLARLKRNLAAAKSEPEDEFAGADVSAPDPRRRRSADKSLGSAAAEDPFARLITPLSGPQIQALAAEIRADELLFNKIRREHRQFVRRHTIGLFFAVLTLVMFAVTRGHEYIQTTLAHAAQPTWLTDALGKSHAGALLFGLGLVVPLLSINMLAQAYSSILKVVFGRSAKALGSALLSGAFSWVVLTLLLDGRPIPAAATLAVWMVLRAVISLITERGDES